MIRVDVKHPLALVLTGKSRPTDKAQSQDGEEGQKPPHSSSPRKAVAPTVRA
jgi:hypothetical protein